MTFEIEVTSSSVKMMPDGSLATSEPDHMVVLMPVSLKLRLSSTPPPVMAT